MAIEKELETLHTNLKALGAAREKLDFASSNVATVTEAIVRTGESMHRLAEMPELTERVRTSVDRLINESKSQQTELQACRQKLESVSKVALTAVFLGVLQFVALIALLVKMLG